MTGIFCPLVSCLLLPRLVSIPYPHIYTTTGTPPRFTQRSRWSPAIDSRNSEDGPDQPGCTPHTIYPLLPHGIPYWTARVYVTRCNETPQSLPLISLTSPEPTRH